MSDRNTQLADIVITLLDATDETGVHNFVRTGTDGATIYAFYINSSSDCVWKKSTDSGLTWSSETAVEATDACISVSVWYDRWTIGDTTGNTIHIVVIDSTNLEATYYSLGVDDDLPESNNNVLIDTGATTITPPAGGQCFIVKMKTSANGDLMVGYAANAHAGANGWQFHLTNDDGATWADKSAVGGNPRSTLSSQNDIANCVPLSTDNDLLLVGGDDSGEIFYTWVWDNVGSTWETKKILWYGTEVASSAASGNHTISIAINKSNADAYIAISSNTNSQIHPKTLHVKYVESTRAVDFSTYSIISGLDGQTTQNLSVTLNFIYSGSIIRNESTGELIYIGITGQVFGADALAWTISSDDGKHWSDIFYFQGVKSATVTQYDDFRATRAPPFVVTGDGYQACINNDDLQDLECFKKPLKIGTQQTGNVKDDGGTNVQDVVVRGYLQNKRGGITDWNTKYIGETVSDSSGNWTLSIPPADLRDNLQDQRNFFVTYYEDKGDMATPPTAVPRLDTDQDGNIATGTQITRDTADSAIDFTTGSSTDDNDYETKSTPCFATLQLPQTVDFDFRVDTLTQGAGTIDGVILVLFVNSDTGGVDFNQKGSYGMRLSVDSGKKEYELIFMNNQQPLTTSNVVAFAHVGAVETLYFRMGLKSENIFSVAMYDNALRRAGDLIEEETFDISSITLNADATELMGTFMIATDDFADAAHVIAGAVKNIKFYAELVGDVTAGDSGSDTDEVDMSHHQGQV